MIFHLALESDWRAAGESYRISTRGRTLDQVGFVHCSADLAQVRAVAAAFYTDLDEPLLLLHIDPAGLDVRVEDGYPHVYGPLPHASVVRATPYPGDVQRTG